MFNTNFIYEVKLLMRSNWLTILIVGISVLFAFATYNGTNNVTKRLDDISVMQEELNKSDSTVLATLIQIENGEEVSVPRWKLPTEPMNIGYRHPRLAVMNPGALSFLATGQSDMYTHVKRPRAYGNNFALDYSEMVNPVQLLLGTFDLAFVIIYIFPLLIIAFTFNVLSKEKERGTLRLLGAQPISIPKWVTQKMMARYIVFTSITILILLVTLALFNSDVFSESSNIVGLVLLIAGYILFWFVLSFIVNIKVNDSSKNAFLLMGSWLLIVMVLPATVNQIGSTLYPTPSRLKMINEIRWTEKVNKEMQDVILDDYLRDHHELAQGSNEDKFGFWHNYFASEQVMEEKTAPLLQKYDEQLRQQRNLIRMFKYLSPAILMQQSLNNIAGTSEEHYNSYKKQVFEFSNTWKAYFIPMLFKGEKFTTEDYKNLPQFTYENRVSNTIGFNTIIILLISGFVFLVFVGKTIKSKTIQTI